MPRTKSFKSGNSVAVRLPKELGIQAGTELDIRKEGEVIEIRPTRETIDLTGIAGSVPWLKPLTAEERIMEPRELDWEGKLLKRD